MNAAPDDDQEKLVDDVRKTISDNERFLIALKQENADVTDVTDEAADEIEEEFEEL